MIHKAKKSLGLKKFPKQNFSPETFHKAKKSLGQNFLKSQVALRALCDAGFIKDTDTVVEIGPGKGALTAHLLNKAKQVIAIEMDHDLIEHLQEKFQTEINEGKLILIEGDCLDFDPLLIQGGVALSRGGNPELITTSPFGYSSSIRRRENSYKLIANIPYNITGLILKKFLEEEDNKPENMVLVVQKEVAERIVCRDNKESILSLSVKLFSQPKYIMKISKKFFSPAPAVDSAIIAMYDIKSVEKNFTDLFFKIIKKSFAHKRKVLKKNLESVLQKEQIESLFRELKLPLQVRAEDIPYEQWLNIVKFLEKIV